MRIIARSTLTGFVANRVEASQRNSLQSHLDVWYAQASKATWQNSAELKQQFLSASILTSERVVFNIRGNHYRLVVAIQFHYQVLLILWLGTHQEYDRIDARKVEYGKRRYLDPSNSH